MGFLHKLWDETLAGPLPETGLGKLRKFNSFAAGGRSSVDLPDREVIVTRSITIIRTNSVFPNISIDSGSAPASPAGTSSPGTPFSSMTPKGDFKWRQSKTEPLAHTESRSPTIYDWFSSLFAFDFPL